jgi:hypothetical protein
MTDVLLLEPIEILGIKPEDQGAVITLKNIDGTIVAIYCDDDILEAIIAAAERQPDNLDNLRQPRTDIRGFCCALHLLFIRVGLGIYPQGYDQLTPSCM